MEQIAHLIQQLDAAREAMRAALVGLDIRMEIYPGWTIKEMLAHIAGWDDASTTSLHAHLHGNEPATPAVLGIDFYNAQSVETRQALDYEHTRKEWELAREQLKAAIREMPPEKLGGPMLFAWGHTGSIAELVAIFASHEREHAREVQEIKAGRVK
jgi:hypothetical protein